MPHLSSRPPFGHPRCHTLSLPFPTFSRTLASRTARTPHRLRTLTRAGNAAGKGTVRSHHRSQLNEEEGSAKVLRTHQARETSRMRLLAVALGFLLQAWIASCGVRDKTGRWRRSRHRRTKNCYPPPPPLEIKNIRGNSVEIYFFFFLIIFLKSQLSPMSLKRKK